MSFDLVPLGSLAKFINGDRGENYPKPSDYIPEGIPFLSATDVGEGKIAWNEAKKISSASYSKLRSGQIRRGDILFCLRGSLGKFGYVESDSEGAIASSLVILRAGNESVARYLRFFLGSADAQSEIKSLDNGSVQGNISAAALKGLLVPSPPERIRASITTILESLDGRIDNNRRINQTLEAMAQAIFKSWFVDFDPVKAKIAAIEQGQDPLRAAMRAISGKTDVELDQMPREHHNQLAATAALFPDAMEESELGEIPKGWRSEAIGYYFDLTMGQSPPGNTYNETGEGMPFYQGRTDFGVRFPTERVYCTAPTRLAKKRDVLVSVRAPVGDINVAVSDCAIGRGVAAVRYEHPSFALYVLRHQEPAFKRFESDGTVFGSINKKQFESLPFVVAPDELVRRFQSLVGPLDEKIEGNEWQMRNIAILRDTLLPKLLSGELSVAAISEE